MPNIAVYPKTPPVVTGVTFAAGDTTSKKTIVTAAAGGSRLHSLSICSDDTVARVFNIYRTTGGTDYIVGTVNVPITAGTDGAVTAAVDLLTDASIMPWIRRDSNGRAYLDMGNAELLKAACQTTITAAKTITFYAVQGDYA